MDRHPYSLYRRNGHYIFFSCMIGLDKNGVLVGGGVGVETRQILKNIEEILSKHFDLDLSYVMDVRISLIDQADYEEMNQTYGSFWHPPNEYPTRECVVVKGLWSGARVAIKALASLNFNQ
ncbi:MAG: RidA family protein [bacterium]|nr:RidA family protein [bacterium]